MKRLFVDTNIVIDLLAKREPFYEEAATLVEQIRLLEQPTPTAP